QDPTKGLPQAGRDQANTIDREAVAKLLADLDQLFAAGDADAYLGRFAPDNRALHERFAERLRRLLHGKPGWTRHSELRYDLRTIGPRTVAAVRSELRLPGDVPQLVETGFLVLRHDGARLLPT